MLLMFFLSNFRYEREGWDSKRGREKSPATELEGSWVQKQILIWYPQKQKTCSNLLKIPTQTSSILSSSWLVLMPWHDVQVLRIRQHAAPGMAHPASAWPAHSQGVDPTVHHLPDELVDALLLGRPTQVEEPYRPAHIPYTPWDCHISRSIDPPGTTPGRFSAVLTGSPMGRVWVYRYPIVGS